MAMKKRISGEKFAQDDGESSQHHPPPSVQPVEHDSKRTGGGLHRQRNALRGNTEEGAGEQHPEHAAAQHATGSFTGENSTLSRRKSGQG
jgi:hypothetical protein